MVCYEAVNVLRKLFPTQIKYTFKFVESLWLTLIGTVIGKTYFFEAIAVSGNPIEINFRFQRFEKLCKNFIKCKLILSVHILILWTFVP